MTDSELKRIGDAIKSKHLGWDDIQKIYAELKRLRKENIKLEDYKFRYESCSK